MRFTECKFYPFSLVRTANKEILSELNNNNSKIVEILAYRYTYAGTYGVIVIYGVIFNQVFVAARPSLCGRSKNAQEVVSHIAEGASILMPSSSIRTYIKSGPPYFAVGIRFIDVAFFRSFWLRKQKKTR